MEYWKKDWKGIARFVFRYSGPELAREVGDVEALCYARSAHTLSAIASTATRSLHYASGLRV
jgi:hypothetical protein